MIEPARAEARIILYPGDPSTAGAAVRSRSDDELYDDGAAHAAVLRRPAEAQRRPARPRAALLGLMLSCLAFMAAIGLREPAVRAVPPLARAYAAIGLPVNLRGLEIRGLKSSLSQDASGRVLAVEGEIVNIRPRAIAVPEVRIAVVGADGHEIYTWTTAVPKARLAEGETIDFRARLTTPPKDAHAVLVRFAAVD
jgi:hypothetical protein